MNEEKLVKIKFDDTSIRWKKTIDILTGLFLFLTASAAFWGGIIGNQALQEYKKANNEHSKSNNAQMTIALYTMDEETNKQILDKPFLQAIYAIPPKDNDKKLTSIKLLKLFIDKKKKDTVSANWKDIPDLYDKLFKTVDDSDFQDTNKQRLRTAFFAMENLFYTILNAYEAKCYDTITDNDYETYAAYFYEIGQNPLFLCAIYDAHKYDYITKRFAMEVHNRLKDERNPETIKVLNIIYPDLLSPNWVDRCGNRGINFGQK